MSSSPSSFQELNRRRAEKAAQRQQTSNTTSFSDVQAQQTLMNLVDGFRKGEPVTWPPDFATVVFNSVRFFLPKILFFHFLFLFFSSFLVPFTTPGLFQWFLSFIHISCWMACGCDCTVAASSEDRSWMGNFIQRASTSSRSPRTSSWSSPSSPTCHRPWYVTFGKDDESW